MVRLSVHAVACRRHRCRPGRRPRCCCRCRCLENRCTGAQTTCAVGTAGAAFAALAARCRHPGHRERDAVIAVKLLPPVAFQPTLPLLPPLPPASSSPTRGGSGAAAPPEPAQTALAACCRRPLASLSCPVPLVALCCWRCCCCLLFCAIAHMLVSAVVSVSFWLLPVALLPCAPALPALLCCPLLPSLLALLAQSVAIRARYYIRVPLPLRQLPAVLWRYLTPPSLPSPGGCTPGATSRHRHHHCHWRCRQSSGLLASTPLSLLRPAALSPSAAAAVADQDLRVVATLPPAAVLSWEDAVISAAVVVTCRPGHRRPDRAVGVYSPARLPASPLVLPPPTELGCCSCCRRRCPEQLQHCGQAARPPSPGSAVPSATITAASSPATVGIRNRIRPVLSIATDTCRWSATEGAHCRCRRPLPTAPDQHSRRSSLRWRSLFCYAPLAPLHAAGALPSPAGILNSQPLLLPDRHSAGTVAVAADLCCLCRSRPRAPHPYLLRPSAPLPPACHSLPPKAEPGEQTCVSRCRCLLMPVPDRR